MNAALPNRAFGVLVFAAWAQRAVWCQYYNEQIGNGIGGDGGGGGHHNEEHLQKEPYIKPLYKYGYWVHDPKTNDVKNHWEHRDGDVVHGSYSLLQPDGHIRLVEYTADKVSGFRAHVKYMHDGSGGGGGGGGGGGSGGGGDFSPHVLDDAAEGQSSQIGDGRSGHAAPKKSLKKYYKKPRTDKPGGPAGHYNRKSQHDNFDARGKPIGGGFKKHRPRPAEYQSSGFDQLPKFQSVGGGGGGGGGGGSSPERYHGSPLLQDSPFGSDNGAPSDFFSRKYSAPPKSAAPLASASADRSAYYTGIQHHQPSEHRRPEQPSSSRPQRSHNEDYGAVGVGDDDEHSQETPLGRDGSDVTIQKLSPLREYHYEEPYPFEIPKGLRAADLFRAPHQKRHLWPAVPSPSGPARAQWYSGGAAETSANYSADERPDADDY